MAWTDLVPSARQAQSLRRVEVIGEVARIGGCVDIGSFGRLSDYVTALPGPMRLHDAVVLNRRGMATSDAMPELRLQPDQLVIIGESEADPAGNGEDAHVPAPETFVSKRRQRATIITRSHVVTGSISLYPGASAAAFLEATDPPYIPVEDATVRWLADRRLRRCFAFALVKRSHIVGVAADEAEWPAPTSIPAGMLPWQPA